jgi:carbon starvation protein
MVYLFIASIVLFILGYRYYGAYLERRFGINPKRTTPAHSSYDGLDYVPAKTPVLIGHHFSSIAGAGPIVGPIIATAFFGWLPSVIWIVLGSILIGGVHDFSSLVISIRHKSRSIAEVAKELMSPTAHRLYLVFIWFTLVYVLTVFVDLTAVTFTENGGVATSSLIYIVLAILLGLSLYRFGASLVKASLIFVPLVFLSIYIGQIIPMGTPSAVAHGDPKSTWTVILLGYCFIASVTPVWILLQPRDYLSSYLLFACIIGGVGGIFLGHPTLASPPYLGFHANIGYLFPALFITIACGACSGFHSIVASGTTAKQLNNERAARPVAYGSMLTEGLLALIAVAAIVVAGGALKGSAPPQVFANGMGQFLGFLGIPESIGISFGLLALSTFLLTTLDTGTRLARYILEELFDVWGFKAHIAATVATLALPLWFALIEIKDAAGQVIPAWKAIWPVFGSTNQLLGALALLTVAVWLKRTGKKYLFVLLPMVFMLAVTLLALIQLTVQSRLTVIGTIAGLLFILGVVLVFEALKAFSGETIDEDETVGEEPA